VLREIFPNAIHLQPDDSGKHLWALFVDDTDTIRVNLLYGSREERLNVQEAAVRAAFAATAQVGNNGIGGRICHVRSDRHYSERTDQVRPGLDPTAAGLV
jgi:hypothetical protein